VTLTQAASTATKRSLKQSRQSCSRRGFLPKSLTTPTLNLTLDEGGPTRAGRLGRLMKSANVDASWIVDPRPIAYNLTPLTEFFSRTELSEIIPNVARYKCIEGITEGDGATLATRGYLNTKEPQANPPVTVEEYWFMRARLTDGSSDRGMATGIWLPVPARSTAFHRGRGSCPTVPAEPYSCPLALHGGSNQVSVSRRWSKR
jgi:hypothetical protein